VKRTELALEIGVCDVVAAQPHDTWICSTIAAMGQKDIVGKAVSRNHRTSPDRSRETGGVCLAGGCHPEQYG